MSLENLVEDADDCQHGQKRGNRYVSEFLSLRSAPDILNAVYPLGKRVEKEITESMAIIRHLRHTFLKEPDKYTLYDLCAGNALTSVTAAHLLPVKQAIAIDSKPRERKWHAVRKFSYVFEDLKHTSADYFAEDSIIAAVHPCRSLAPKIIELYKKSKASHLVLMPCCVGAFDKRYEFVVSLLDKYYAWAFQLAELAGGRISVDKNVLSPRDAIIVARK